MALIWHFWLSAKSVATTWYLRHNKIVEFHHSHPLVSQQQEHSTTVIGPFA